MKNLLISSFALVSVLAAAAETTPAQIVGTWLLNGADKNTRWVFSKDGSFAFTGIDASSKGNWSSDGSKIILVWTEVDREKVAPGSIKGAYPFMSDGSWQVDRYNYRKS